MISAPAYYLSFQLRKKIDYFTRSPHKKLNYREENNRECSPVNREELWFKIEHQIFRDLKTDVSLRL